VQVVFLVGEGKTGVAIRHIHFIQRSARTCCNSYRLSTLFHVIR
jgi:hypothetical protein